MQLQEIIRKMELESFESLAKRYGISADDLIEKLINYYNRHMSVFFEIDKIRDNHTKQKHPLKTKRDWWNGVHKSYGWMKTEAIKLIYSYLDQNVESLDFDSIRKMASALNINEKKSDSSNIFLRHFMEKIPVVVLYDLEFNAEAFCGFISENIPVVRHFDFLHDMLRMLLETSCFLAYEEKVVDGKTGIQYREGFTDFSSENFKFAVNQINKLILVSTGHIKELSFNLPWSAEARRNLHIEYLISTFYRIASNFVWIHEFAHMLYGDVMKNYWHEEMEFRCDRLAMKCLFNANKFDKSYVWVGISFLLTLLERLAQIDEHMKKLPKNLSNLISYRGAVTHDYIFGRLTEEEKKMCYYYWYLVELLIQAA
jgi:hypothetical protein